jgi:hypothetical protein
MSTAQSVTIEHPVILIAINKLFRSDMSPRELYEATRGVGKLGKHREDAGCALFRVPINPLLVRSRQALQNRLAFLIGAMCRPVIWR